MNPYSLPDIKQYSVSKLLTDAWPKMLTSLPDYATEERRKQIHLVYDQLSNIIPENSIVSTPQFAYPALYRKRTLYPFPIGLDEADFAIVGAVTYLGEENRQLLDLCLRGPMRRKGYDMDHPILAGNVPVYRHGSRATLHAHMR